MSSEKQSQEPLLSVEEALVSGVSKPSAPRPWLWVLSAFILAFYLPVLFWLFRDYPTADESIPPPQFPMKGEIESYCMKAMIFCGSVQCWSVFSPNVNHMIYHETAVITYQDGATKLYEFPRMVKRSYVERFKHEKLRKIFGDCIPWPSYVTFLPSVSRYLSLSNCNSRNQPTMLTLIFNSSENPKPDPGNWNYRDKLPWHTDKNITFVYSVRASDVAPQQGLANTRSGDSRINNQLFDTSAQDGTI